MDEIRFRLEKLLFALQLKIFKTYRDFIHQGLDLVDDLVSVGLVYVGAEGDFTLLSALRYGRHTEHLGSGVKKTLKIFFLLSVCGQNCLSGSGFGHRDDDEGCQDWSKERLILTEGS